MANLRIMRQTSVLLLAVVCAAHPLALSGIAVAATLPSVVDLAGVPGSEGTPFTRSYPGAGDQMSEGNQNIAVADFNGDGFDDMAIGYGRYAPPASSGNARGRVIVVLGGPVVGEQALGEVSTALYITNVDDDAQFGYSVAAGDVSDDGRPDLVIGAPGARAGKGAVVVLENSLFIGGGTITVTTDGTDPFGGEARYLGTDGAGGLGYAVACADLTDDGAAEIIAGEPGATVGGNAYSGKVYVGFGSNFSPGITLDFANEPEVYEISGGMNMQLGAAVATGDLDGDGRPELLIGAPAPDLATGAVYGIPDVSPGPNAMDVTDPGALSMILRLHGFAGLGFSLDSGDMNGDARADILAGMPLHSPTLERTNAGGAVLFAGRTGIAGQNIDVSSNVQATSLVQYRGWQAGDRAGASVALGDLNGDGVLDVLLGQPFAKGSDDAEGLFGRIGAYVNYGKLSETYSLIDMAFNTPDVQIFGGSEADLLGAALNAQGDLNRDGFADLVASASFAEHTPGSVGIVHTLYGDGVGQHASGVLALGSGDTQVMGIGGTLSPVVRTQARFSSGTSGTVTAAITRSRTTISNLGNGFGTNLARAVWNVSTTRSGWTSVELRFTCTDAELAGLGEDTFSVYRAANLAGPWTEVAVQSYDAIANQFTVETSSLGYFAVVSDAPVITLNGDELEIVECKEAWVDPGFTAVAFDGTVISDLVVVGGDLVDVTALGEEFEITYDVEDSLGNAAITVMRRVQVVDTTPPIVNGGGYVPVGCGEAYIPSYGVEDCEDLDDQVVVIGDEVDTNVVGRYFQTWSVTDSSGNPANPRFVEVEVVDTLDPVVTILGPNPLFLECGETYTDPGVEVTDCDTTIGPAVVGGDTVNTSVAGNYLVTYRATDPSGNFSVATREVKVVDSVPPVIQLSSSGIQTACGFQPSYPSVTVIDCAPGLAGAVVVAGDTVDINTPGFYTITYNVSDPSGNAAEEATYTIEIADATPPVITLIGANPLTLNCGETYLDPGATATDNCAGVAGNVGIVENTVNTDITGSYLVRYQVADNSGNIAEVVRTVTVAGVCGTGVIEDCPGESVLSQLPDDGSGLGAPAPSGDGGDVALDYFYLYPNRAFTGITWWGFGADDGGLPCVRSGDSFQVDFYTSQNLGGGVWVPSASSKRSVLVSPTVESTGFTDAQGNEVLRYTAQFETPVQLDDCVDCSVELWVSVLGLGSPDCRFQWLDSPYGSSPIGNDYYRTGPDAENTVVVPGADLAFCLEGVPPSEGEGEGEGQSPIHTADQNGDGLISLSELLRLIQFYNSLNYGCEAGTEDGYAPNDPDQDCAPHASDYNTQDWDIALTELLRLIQFYNLGGYVQCLEGEDGYCLTN